MSEKREINIEESYAKKLRYITIALTVLFVFTGAYVVYEGWGFFDTSLVYLLVPYILCVIGFYIAMSAERFLIIFSTLIVGIICLILMSNSFEWRRGYVENGFVLESYIDKYPSYIEQVSISVMGGADVVSFGNECLGTKKHQVERITLPNECHSRDSIIQNYNVDVNDLLRNYHKKMQSTAKQIEAGRAQQIGYPRCVNTKKCAFIPLPPQDMTEAQISESTDSKVTILRDGFWDLIEKNYITANVCLNMYLCNRLVELGVFTSKDLTVLQGRQGASDQKVHTPTHVPTDNPIDQ